MSRVLHYLIHPALEKSHANATLWKKSEHVPDITRVDLYAEYPRHNIDVDCEQQRLVDHDVVLFQFPMFWYAAPSLLKEWTDLVLEQGFAFGPGGDKLAGKKVQLIVSTGGSEHAFSPQGYQQRDIRQFLTPYEQTAHLCHMEFLTPFIFFDAIRENSEKPAEVFAQMLTHMRDDTLNFDALGQSDTLTPTGLTQLWGA